MGGDGGDGGGDGGVGGNASDGSDGANAAAAAGLGVSDNANAPSDTGTSGADSIGGQAAQAAADDSESDTGPSIGVQGLAATADAQAAMNAMAAQYGFAETGYGTVGQATTADAANLGYGFGNIGGFGFGPSIGVSGFGVGTSSGFGTVGEATAPGFGTPGFGNIGGFTGENEGFGIPGANLGFNDVGTLSQATINAVNEQDAYGFMSNPTNFTAPPAPPAPPSTTPSLAELGLNVPSLSDINEAQSNLGLFGIAPTVTAPSPFGQQASFAIAPETSVQENMTGLLGMTLDEQQAAIDAKDAKEAQTQTQTQEETSPKSFEQQAINIAMQQALEAKDTIDGILGVPPSPQATPTAPATASFTGFSQSPPGVVGVAPPASMTATGFSPSPPGVVGVAPTGMTATGFSPSPPGVVGVPGTPGFTGLGVDPDNPAPPTTPVDPDNPVVDPTTLSRPPTIPEESLPFPTPLSPQVQVPMPVSRPDAANLPNAGIVGPPTSLDAPTSGVVGPPTGVFGQPATPPTSFSNTTGLVGPTVNAFGQMAAVATPPAPVVAETTSSPLGVLPSQVTPDQFTQSQQQALQQLSEPAKGPTLAQSLGLSPGTLGTGITGFTPGSNLANIAAIDGPVAAAAVATGFPVTAAKAMQSLYSIPV